MPATRSITWHLFQPSHVRKVVRKHSKSLLLEQEIRFCSTQDFFQMTDYVLRTTEVGYAPKSHLNFSGLSSAMMELFQTQKHLEKNSDTYKTR